MKYLYGLLIFVPLAIAAELMHASPLVIFSLSAAAIVPLSGILGTATEELAGHTGATVGGLINATPLQFWDSSFRLSSLLHTLTPRGALPS